MSCIYKYKGKDYTKDEFYSLVRTTMVQPRTVQKYEKVLFPKGDTAAKIEGHETLEEFKKQKEDRIKELERELQHLEKTGKDKIEMPTQPSTGPRIVGRMNLGKSKEDLNNEIQRLKQELANVESGRIQLSSIANFYETTITNILKKNGFNPVEITDEYGNKWSEVELDEKRDSKQIEFQKDNEGKPVGQIDLKALEILVDLTRGKIDTLPHEFAHYYIKLFKDSVIVKEAIKKWGSEEALVQAIGEQTVKQKGEAYNWWENFSRWVKEIFANLDSRSKEQLAEILTDAFLQRADLYEIEENSKKQLQEDSTNNQESSDSFKVDEALVDVVDTEGFEDIYDNDYSFPTEADEFDVSLQDDSSYDYSSLDDGTIVDESSEVNLFENKSIGEDKIKAFSTTSSESLIPQLYEESSTQEESKDGLEDELEDETENDSDFLEGLLDQTENDKC